MQSFYADCCLILEIAVWLWRLPSGMSGMREISEWKANALNFFKPVLSTNQRPQFLALNQWEASISGPPILTHFINQTAIAAIRQPSQQSDCNLSNQTAISAIRLQSQQSDCNPSALQLDYTDWFELQNRTAILYCCGLHLDYTERKIQSLGNIWKVLAHGVHQAVRFTWVWLLQDYLKIASNCFGLLGLHLDC